MSSTSLTSIFRQISSPLSGDLRYYTRLSLVILMRIAKAHIITDWAKCMSRFREKVENDRQLPIGGNSLQELVLSLHIHGVSEDKSLAMSPTELEIAAIASARSKSRLAIIFQEPNPPSVIHIALLVPRNRLRVFTAESPDRTGTPGLHLSVNNLSVNAENSFFAIKCFFGQLKARVDDSSLCDVEEDDLGWAGSADLVVTCAIPAYTLCIGEADDLRVALVVNTSPSNLQYTMKLGFRMVVYECGLQERRRLWLLREAPGTVHAVAEQRHLSNTEIDKNLSKISTVSVELDHEFKSKSLRFHADFPKASDESDSLSDGAKVTVTQSSPRTMTLQIGTTKPRCLVYPFPVDGSVARTRIARKSLWVDVIVPIAHALSNGGYNNIFPVTSESSQPSVWSISRVNLQQQSIINVPGKFDWLLIHLDLTLSAAEQSLCYPDVSDRPSNGLLDLKMSLNLLFRSFVGRNDATKLKPMRNFQLSTNGDSDTMIHSHAIRHDRDTGSILMDGYVIYLTHSRVLEMASFMQSVPQEDILTIKLSREESILWKRLLPTLVERCRQTWNHRSECEYRGRNRIPLSTMHGEMPICSCGEGQDLDVYPTDVQYQKLAKYATRIAIPLLFAVPYVEVLGLEASSMLANDAAIPAAFANLGQDHTRQSGGLNSLLGRATAATAAPMAKCDHCQAEKPGLKACARCGIARYCNHACQKAAWKEHKKVCNK